MSTPTNRASAMPLDGDAEQLEAMSPTTSGPAAHWRTLALEIGLILAGGVIGTLARVGVSLTLGHALDHGFPWDIAFINVSGALGIGLLAGWRDPHSRRHELLWLAGAVGFMGAYTTFSSFALGIVTLAITGQTLLALLYATGSTAAGLVAVEAGMALGKRLRC
ncbi:MAG: CrcB family protein [Ktedonobacterales bacterium]|nr:CrcB family protein [Ktedonobacterales bacterium]